MENIHLDVKFEVLTMKNTVLLPGMSCRLVDCYQYFKGTCGVHLQGRRAKKAYPDDGGSRFF
jgi:hypothetical protein